MKHLEQCPICGEQAMRLHRGPYGTKFTDRDGTVRDLVVPGVERRLCTSCGQEILEPDAEYKVSEARRGALGLLTAEELLAFRQRWQKTQTEMSDLLGVGEKTYCRWESGDYIQSEAFDRYLRLLIEEPSNVGVLHGIILAKEFKSVPGMIEQVRAVFSYLGDFPDVEKTEKQFLEAMASGTLQYSGREAR